MTRGISPIEFLNNRPPIATRLEDIIDFFNKRLSSGDPEKVQMHVRTEENNRILKVIIHVPVELFPVDPSLYTQIQDTYVVSGWDRCIITQFAQEENLPHTVVMLEQDNPITK